MIRGVTRERVQAPHVRIATTLMYHAVRGGSSGPSTDDIYTITEQQFIDQLDLIAETGLPVSTVGDLATANGSERRREEPALNQAIALTFDDGMTSHLEPVLRLLWERNMPGEFFVNPANVGKHGFLSWNELRGMASAGMSIQSHGYSHRYMDDLDDAVLADELLRSKQVIEDRLGRPVTVFAAPGGRVNGFVAALAHRVGYRVVCGSRPGQWRPNSRTNIIPRIAIRASTTVEELRDWINSRPLALAVQAGRYQVLQLARRVLGNHMYDNLRQRYLGES